MTPASCKLVTSYLVKVITQSWDGGGGQVAFLCVTVISGATRQHVVLAQYEGRTLATSLPELFEPSRNLKSVVEPLFSAQTLIHVNLLLANLFSCLVITRHQTRVKTCRFDRILPLCLQDLPKPTRTSNAGNRF